MAEQRNDTAWQQGFILDKETAIDLGLAKPDAEDNAVVVLISHDCDLLEPPEVEPNCEVIVGRQIGAINGLYTNGKNPRRLHLTFSAGSKQALVELIATDKKLIEKGGLLSRAPLEEFRLNQDEHFVLQSWLAARYHRPIFPEEFDRRLKAKPAETHKKIANAIKATGNDIVAVLFELDSGKDEIHDGAEDPYSLTILLVYSVSDEPKQLAR